MVKIFVGNEPYLIDYHIKRSSQGITLPDFNLLKANSFGEDEKEFLATFPIIDECRCVVVTVKHLDDLANSNFKDLLAEEKTGENTNIVLCIAKDYDKRTAFYKKLMKSGFIVSCEKVDMAQKVPEYLKRQVSQRGVRFAPGVAEEVVKRCGYVENVEVNMYTVFSYANNMIPLAVDGVISMEVMQHIVPCYYESNAFGLGKLICSKDLKALSIQAELLRGDEINTLSKLLREYRISYKAKYYSLKEIGVTYSPFLKKDKEYLLYGLNLITNTIAGIKNGTVMEATCLMEVFLRLCSFEREVV